MTLPMNTDPNAQAINSPAVSPVTGEPKTLALFSLLLSLVFPLGLAIGIFDSVVFAKPTLSQDPSVEGIKAALGMLSFAMCALGVPCIVAAIVTGHRALRLTAPSKGLWMARVGLVISYLSTVVCIILVLVIGWVFVEFATHPW
jgi:hypothetical protein